jgi:hypothetical protein
MLGKDLDDFSLSKKYKDGIGIFVRGKNIGWRAKYKGCYYGDSSDWDEPDIEKAHAMYLKKFREIKETIDRKI